jgi:opacity protein-like surface antigen
LLLAGVAALIAGPAMAQDVKTLLQAADQAIGASKLNSMEWTAKGRGAYLGQNFTVNDDWNRYDLQSFTWVADLQSQASAVRVAVEVEKANAASRCDDTATTATLTSPRTSVMAATANRPRFPAAGSTRIC